MVLYMSITVNTQKKFVPIMDKEVHGNKQKYNLQVYSKTFQFIHNSRRTKTREEERVREILCYQ